MPDRCPHDDEALQDAVGKLEERVCPKCAGRFLPASGAERLLDVEGGIDVEMLRELNALYAGASLACPGCGGQMSPVRLKGLSVDHCLQCGGVWLDAGELKELSRGEHVEPERPTPEPEPEPEPEPAPEPEGWPPNDWILRGAPAALFLLGCAAIAIGMGLAVTQPTEIEVMCEPFGTKVRCERIEHSFSGVVSETLLGRRLMTEIEEVPGKQVSFRVRVSLIGIGELLEQGFGYLAAAQHFADQARALNQRRAPDFYGSEERAPFLWFLVGFIALPAWRRALRRR